MFDLKITGGTVVDGTGAGRSPGRHGVDTGARPGQLIRGVR
jgi:hypothetical protein